MDSPSEGPEGARPLTIAPEPTVFQESPGDLLCLCFVEPIAINVPPRQLVSSCCILLFGIHVAKFACSVPSFSVSLACRTWFRFRFLRRDRLKGAGRSKKDARKKLCVCLYDAIPAPCAPVRRRADTGCNVIAHSTPIPTTILPVTTSFEISVCT